jgi:hypothetical protein
MFRQPSRRFPLQPSKERIMQGQLLARLFYYSVSKAMETQLNQGDRDYVKENTAYTSRIDTRQLGAVSETSWTAAGLCEFGLAWY